MDRKSFTVDPQRRGTLNPPNRVLGEGRPRTWTSKMSDEELYEETGVGR